MTLSDDIPLTERQRFFDGEELFASDLQNIESFNRRMRWLHNSSLHQPGIGSGLAVSGAKGDREVVVSPGYAIDDEGREIVLTRSTSLPIPPVGGDVSKGAIGYYLTIAYKEDDTATIVETRQGLCGSVGAVRLAEEPVFCWAELAMGPNGAPVVKDPNLKKDILQRRRLVLAQVAILSCKLYQPVDTARHRGARPDCGPRVRCGRVALTGKLTIEKPAGGTLVKYVAGRGVRRARHERLVIPTGHDFITTPTYTVTIEGPRHFSRAAEGFEVFLLGERAVIEDAKPHSLTVRVSTFVVFGGKGSRERRDPEIAAKKQTKLLRDLTPAHTDALALSIANYWSLAWMAVEN